MTVKLGGTLGFRLRRSGVVSDGSHFGVSVLVIMKWIHSPPFLLSTNKPESPPRVLFEKAAAGCPG